MQSDVYLFHCDKINRCLTTDDAETIRRKCCIDVALIMQDTNFPEYAMYAFAHQYIIPARQTFPHLQGTPVR